MEHRKIGFIGAGNMAFAIASAVIANSEITVYDKNSEQYERFAEIGAKSADTLAELFSRSEVIFLSVKPQNFEELFCELNNLSISGDKLYVSIAAGVTTDYIKKTLACANKVVRVMPNTPLMIGHGAAAISPSEGVPEKDTAYVCDIFSAAGEARIISESEMDAVVAVNGSSPAFIYYFAEVVAAHAASRGIDEETAMTLFCHTLIGSAQMLLSSGHSAEELIKMVSSKGGTTIAAMDALKEKGFAAAITAAMDACEKRSGELAK